MKSNIRLNRIRISASVPDMYNFKSFAGCDGFDVFSAYRICEAVKSNASGLKIDLSKCNYNDLPRYLSAALDSDDTEVKAVSKMIAADFGRRLGLVVYNIKTATEEFRDEYKWYTEQDWQIWHEVKTVFLSGGLANGRLGEMIKYYAEELMHEMGFSDFSFSVYEHPSYAQMIGCARMNMERCKKAVVFDFGHAFIKRCIADFDDCSVKNIEELTKIESRYMGKNFDTDEEKLLEAEQLHNFIVKTVSDTFRENDRDSLSKHIVISIANNIENGKIGHGGCYYKLMYISDEYERYLSRCLSETLNADITVTLIHDGEAAAMCFAGVENSVMIALGTAFGVGFPEYSGELKNIDSVEVIGVSEKSLMYAG